MRTGEQDQQLSFRAIEWRATVAVAVLLVVPLYAGTARWEDSLQSSDTRSPALAAWSLWATGDLAFDERWPPEAAVWEVPGRDGRGYSNRFPGIIAIATVAYAIPVATGLVSTEPVSHPADVPIWPATLAAVLVGAVAAVLTYRLFRELPLSRSAAIAAGTLVALGSPLWSVSADALWTHGVTHALLVGLLLARLRGRSQLATVLAAAAVTVRPHLIVSVLVIALLGERSWRGRARLTAGGVTGLAVVAAYSLWLFGQPLPAAGYRIDGLAEQAPILHPASMASNLADWMFSPTTGLLLSVPVAVLAVPYLRSAWRSAPSWVRPAALAGLAYALAQLGLIRASGGILFFGHRTTIEALVLASPLLLLSVARLWKEGQVARLVVTGTVLYSLSLHTVGAILDMWPATSRMVEQYQNAPTPEASEPG